MIDKTWDELDKTGDTAVRFDWVKYIISQFTIAYSKERAKTKREKESRLLKKLDMLNEKICNNSIEDFELKHYEQLKKEMEMMEEEKTRGAWVRSRLEHLALDEKSTAFFFNKSKKVFEEKKHLMLFILMMT